MKKVITGFIFAAFLASAPLVMAAGNHWSTLDQQWNRIQKWQKKQSDQFRELETETADSTAASVSASEVKGRIKVKRVSHNYCIHCGQRLPVDAKYCSHCGQPVHE